MFKRQRNSKKCRQKPGGPFDLPRKHSSKTLFGREHDFENIRSVKDFQDRVPVADYEDLKPYIERVKKGREIFSGQIHLNILQKLREQLRDQNIFLYLKKECLIRSQEPKVLYSTISAKKTMQISLTGK